MFCMGGRLKRSRVGVVSTFGGSMNPVGFPWQ